MKYLSLHSCLYVSAVGMKGMKHEEEAWVLVGKHYEKTEA